MVRYKIVSNSVLGSFCQDCEDHMSNGWELVGGVAIRDREYHQTLTKEEERLAPPKKRARAKKAVAPRQK